MTQRSPQSPAASNANIELMHAVLDGQADAQQIAALDALLASDAAAAEQFAVWKTMFRSLSAVSMEHPPEGLVAAISASIPAAPLPARKNNSRAAQLLSDSSVIVSRPAQTTRLASGFRAFFHRSNRPESSKELGQMNASRKIWAGSAVAVLALGVVVFSTGYPPKTENLTGTVVPADRYRATSSSTDVVKPIGAVTTTVGSLAAAAGAEADKVAQSKQANMTAQSQQANMTAQSQQANVTAQSQQANVTAQSQQANMTAQMQQANMTAQSQQANMTAQSQQANMTAQSKQADMTAQSRQANMVAQSKAAERAAQLQQAERAAQSQQADKSQK